MKRFLVILIFVQLACEEEVQVDLPASEGLFVVEGFITDSLQTQQVRLSRSVGFSSGNSILPVQEAQIQVLADDGSSYLFEYSSDGNYRSQSPFAGIAGMSYKIEIEVNGDLIASTWDEMPNRPNPFLLEVSSFEENDPDSDDQITVYYPKVTATDPEKIENYYRWVLLKNDQVLREPDPITIQDDRFFDGNLIPNNFQSFNYEPGEKMGVDLVAISEQTYEFLSLLRSQITTLGRSSGTTPSVVSGNLSFRENQNELVLGYFGVVAIQSESLIVP